MTFDIISYTDEEITSLSTIQLKLLRTAQQKKDELYHTLQQDIQTYKLLTYTNGVAVSSLFADKSKELTEEYEYQVEILREQLIFNMSLNEPTSDGETGESGSDNTGYLVDYSLSYLERYVEVRDYYMSIEDPNERIALYAADTVAQAYLGTYYTGLYDYFSTFT